jgi:excisionase family DNA binding protein
MMISIDEAAKYLGMNSNSVRYLARNKRIPAAKIGRGWRFHQGDLESFVRSQYQATFGTPDKLTKPDAQQTKEGKDGESNDHNF